MRYIDELFALYPGKDPLTRKFLLAQMIDLPADAYTSEISEFLWGETRSADAVVRRQARHTMGQFLPVHTAFSFRFVAPATHGGQDLVESLGGLLVHAGPEGRMLAKGAGLALEHLLPRLAELMGAGSGTQRVATSLVLGRVHTPRIVKGLAKAVLAPKPSWQAAFSLAETGEEYACRALVKAIARHGHERPDLFMLLRGLPSEASMACLSAAAPRTDDTGRANIALALGQLPSKECRPLLERLIRGEEGWVTAYVLDTLAGYGDPDDMPLIRLAYELQTHEFVRAQALRAAGNITSADARAFLEATLPTCGGRNQAIALQSLLRQDIDADELARIARPYLDHENVAAGLCAVLAVGLSDPDPVIEPLSRLLVARSSATRRLGAFALGEIQHPDCMELLERMIATDPSATVRVQAIRAIARYPVEQALPRLIRLLAHGTPKVFLNAGRAIGAIRTRPETVLAALAEAYPTLPVNPRGAVLRAMGRVARPGQCAVPQAILDALGSSDPVLVVGALEGVKHLGDRIPVALVEPLLNHEDAKLRARAALTMFLAGRAPHAETLAPMLASGDEAIAMEALGSLIEIGLVAPYLNQGGFDRVAGDLRDRARGDGAAPPPEPSEPVVDPSILRDMAQKLAMDPKEEALALGRSMRMGSKVRKGDAELGAARGVSRVGMSSRALNARNLAEMVAKTNLATADLEGGASEEMVLEERVGSAPVPTPGSVARSGSSAPWRRPVAPAAEPEERPSVILREKKRAMVPLLGAVAVLALSVGLVWSKLEVPREPDPPPASGASAPPAKTAPRVWALSGPCGRLDAEGTLTAVELGAALQPGRLATRTGARMELGFPDGTSIVFGPATEVTFGGAPPVRTASSAAPVVLDDPSGDLQITAKSMELQIKVGAAGYRTHQSKLRLKSDGANLVLEQLEGDGVLVKTPGGALDTLVPGQSRTLERAAGGPR